MTQYNGTVCTDLFAAPTELLMCVLPSCLLCMQAWHRKLKPAKGKGKKSKQAEQTPEEAVMLESVREWHAGVSAVLASVGAGIKTLQSAIQPEACVDENKHQQDVMRQILSGYNESCTALAGLVKTHTATLKSLKM